MTGVGSWWVASVGRVTLCSLVLSIMSGPPPQFNFFFYPAALTVWNWKCSLLMFNVHFDRLTTFFSDGLSNFHQYVLFLFSWPFYNCFQLMHIVKCVNWIIWLVNQSNPWIHWISKYDLVECIDFNDAVNLCRMLLQKWWWCAVDSCVISVEPVARIREPCLNIWAIFWKIAACY